MRSLIIAFLLLSFACQPTLEGKLDLDPPVLLGTNLPLAGEVSPTAPIQLRFSKPMAPKTINSSTVVVIPFDVFQSCSVDRACAPGVCYHSRCQQDPMTPAWLQDLAHPPLTPTRKDQVALAAVTLDEPGTLASIDFLQPLAPHQHHLLLVSSAVTDRSGNPLKRDANQEAAVKQQKYDVAVIGAGMGVHRGRPEVPVQRGGCR